MIAPADLSLGLLAGGEGRRLGGRDKAWLLRGGRFLVDGLLDALPMDAFADRLASVRDEDARWTARGFRCVRDATPGFAGPLAGIAALSRACRTPWLMLLPVDVLSLPADLVPRLCAMTGQGGAWVRDASGLQPLLGLWPAPRLADAAGRALASGDAAVHRALAPLLPAMLDVSPDVLGNANTPELFDAMP